MLILMIVVKVHFLIVKQPGILVKELDVQLICANSPQAKGRIERLFKTLQDRLVKELRLKKIKTLEEGNKYLEEYIDEHNSLFAVMAAEKENMHRKIKEEELEKSFCYKEQRKLTKNLELSYQGKILQIIPEAEGYSLRKAYVNVIETIKGEIKIEYQGKELAYKKLLMKDHQGRIMNKKEILMGGVFPLGGKAI